MVGIGGESSSSPPSKRKITVQCSDGEFVEVEEEAAMGRLKTGFTEGRERGSVTFPSDILAKVIQYCKKPSDENLYAEYAKEDRSTIVAVCLAAHSLEIKGLEDLLLQIVVDKIKDMSVEQIRDYMGLVNDFSPEEELEIYMESKWAIETLNKK